MPEEDQIYNFKLIVKDYIRTLKLPSAKSKVPVAILLVGIPASGKSYLAKNLIANVPLVFISENDVQSFLVPKMSFFERGQEMITEFAKQIIYSLLCDGYSCIFDANLRTVDVRDEYRSKINKAGGENMLIHLNCSKKVAFERIKKRNFEIVSGESEGFVLDWDYFQYEINTTETPLKRERAFTYDSSKSDHQFDRIVSYLAKKMN